MVTTRNLIITGIVLITVIALASAVVLQQIVIQNMMSRQAIYITETQTLTQQAAEQQTSVAAVGTPYVLLTYYGVTVSLTTTNLEGTCIASSGNTFLAVKVTLEDHGYNSAATTGDYYAVINNQEYSEYGWACIGGMFTDYPTLLNGLSVTGWLLYEVPANYGTFSLVWVPTQSGLNIQYVQQ